MPDPVQGGSSGSHYDTALALNALMEPAINDSLDASLNLDISANLLQDTGWPLNDGNARNGNCDTGVDVVEDAGLIIGANVQATRNPSVSRAGNHGNHHRCRAHNHHRPPATHTGT